jgi:hypothetical protein
MRVRRVAVLIPALVAFAACANAPTHPATGTIEHASGPQDLLVRVNVGGGFVATEWSLTSVPTFSLFGDGTLISPGAQVELYPGPALPAISRRTVDEAGIQAILAEALDATDGVPDDLGDLGSIGIADAPTTRIVVRAGGVDRAIEAYALSEVPERPEGMSEEVYRARQRLAQLVTKLGSLDGWLPTGSLGPEAGYRAAAGRLFVGEYRKVEDLAQQPVAWPLDGPLAGFGNDEGSIGYRCGTLDGAAWSDVRSLAEQANALTPWTDGGDRFLILFRPLLPDESGC